MTHLIELVKPYQLRSLCFKFKEVGYFKIPYFLDYKTHFFFPEKCDLKSTCILYAEGKYLFPNL